MSFFSGRVDLSHASVLTARLWDELNTRLPFMLGSAGDSLPRLASTTPHMSTVISAYARVLTLRKEASGSPPVICIDHADVLMDWYEGDSTTQTASNRC